ncbi:hypothetical protein [Variovorax sp. GB1P17]|uniref:hypothetical protein n=1 Tax=Variovorax sp. GB1P17 TaxID=3443740 RepID=UPI003F4924F8
MMKKLFFALLAAVVAMAATPALAQNNVPPVPGAGRAPGLYVQVLDGLIHVTNPAGTSNFSSGQFGYAPSFRQPPVMLPANPGIPFTPPPAFSSSTPVASNGGAPKSNAVDCEVR